MMKDKSNNKIGKKWKAYITGIITSNFISFNKIDKYFHYPISESSAKAIQENWLRILGIDYEIICMNLFKDNKQLGIALEGRNELSRDAQEVIQRHYLRAIMPTFCIGLTRKFMVKDELLEVNGLKVMGLPTKDVLRALKKLTNYFQIVVARSMHHNYDLASDYGGSEDNINSPISFYDMDEDESSRNGTLRSVASNYSTTSRDFGSSVSFGGMIDGQYENVREYLRNMIGWRGPIIIEFFKQKESLGLALEEIPDPKSSNLIIVFKIIVPGMKAGKDGRLHAGDRLLEVNGKSVKGVPFRHVCKWIKSAPGGRIVFCICKPHFEPTNFNPINSENNDNYLYNTLRDGDKLPKLSEETDSEFNEIPPLPEYMENHITLKRTENKLGIFLDIVDRGKNGARIKKISRGIAKSDGRLKEGDFIIEISGITLRVDEKNQLEYCLKRIASDTQDYNISYITAEDIDLHKNKYATIARQRKQSVQPKVPISHIYPDPASINRLDQTSNESGIEKDKPLKMSFKSFNITIANDFKTNLGLMLSPSLIEPKRFISITYINENSLCYENALLKINDDILMVNDVNFENVSVNEGSQFLIKAINSEPILHFQIRRLMDCENPIIDPLVEKLTQFHDLYLCSIRKGSNGYGFSLSELDYDNVVTVGIVDLNSPAHKVGNLKSGDRFAMINKCNVTECSKIAVMQIVKNSTKRLELVMETPKYREFSVKISKDPTMSLGLNIAGGCDTLAPIPIIESLVPNRSSKFSEELIPGDLIFEVDGKSLVQQNHNEIIQTLRSTGRETTFKIFRKLPYLKRKIFNDIELTDFPESYFQSVRYSVIINKPVDNIKSYGINFTDVVIIDPINEFQILDRFKVVLSIDKNSLAEKYTPEIKCHDFLIAINEVPVDVDILPEDLKGIIDKNNRINLTFSKDIPYNLKGKIKDYDSPILLTKNKYDLQSESSSVDTASIQSNIEPHNEFKSVTPFEDLNEVENNLVNTQPNCSYENQSLTENSEVNNREVIDSQAVGNSNILPPDEIDSSEAKTIVKNEFLEAPSLLNDIDDQTNCDKNLEDNKHNSDINDQLVESHGKKDSPDDKSVEPPFSNGINDQSVESQSKKDSPDDKSVEPPFSNGINDQSVESHGKIDSPDDKSVEPSLSNDINDQTNRDKNLEDNKHNSDISDQSVESQSKIDSPEDKSVEPPFSNDINDQTNRDENLEDKHNSDIQNSGDNPTFEMDTSEAELPISNKHNNNNDVETNNLSALGIDINYIIVNKIANVELGFQLYGGLEGGPNGDTIPVFVVNIERNTCNWPADSDEPLLKNGQQVIELNGQILSALKLSKIETIIKETDNELKFKIVTIK